jgi:hypothetical protein
MEISEINLCSFCDVSSTLDPNSSFDTQDGLRKRWCSISHDRLAEMFLVRGFDMVHFEKVYSYIYDHISELAGDSNTFDQFSVDLETLVTDAAKLSESFFVSERV